MRELNAKCVRAGRAEDYKEAHRIALISGNFEEAVKEAGYWPNEQSAATSPDLFAATPGSETLFKIAPSVSGRVRAAGGREARRAKVKEWKAAHGIFAYKGGCEDWMALSMPECIARLDGYGLTDEEKTCAMALVAGYGRLLDDASLIEYGPTEYETCKALVGRLGAAGDSASDRERKSPNVLLTDDDEQSAPSKQKD